MKSGQILIIVLLIVVVTLAVGLSVASRNITNLRTSTQTEQSQRAFTAAEGGIEDVLSRFSTLKTDPAVTTSSGLNVSVPVGSSGISATVNLKAINYVQRVDTGHVAQINLRDANNVHAHDAPYNVTQVKISWAKAVPGEGDLGKPFPSVEVTFVCQTASSTTPCVNNNNNVAVSGYAQDRVAFTNNSSGDQGFTNCGNSSGVVTSSTVTDPDYNCTITFPLVNSNILLVRVRPFHRRTDIVTGSTIKVSGDQTLPVQLYEISSAVTTDTGIARRVQVTKTALPILPAAFDFALYSEGSIIK